MYADTSLSLSGLLFISAPDFGSPRTVTLAVAVEKPASGLIKFGTSVQFGEPEDVDEESPRDTGKYAQHEEM